LKAASPEFEAGEQPPVAGDNDTQVPNADLDLLLHNG